MPFITEEIWQSIPHEGEALIVAQWPKYQDSLAFPTEEAQMESVMNAIRAVRNRRAEMNVPPSKKTALYVVTSKPDVFQEGRGFVERLAYAAEMTLCDAEPAGYEDMVCCTTVDAKLYIPMGQLVDVAKELERIEKEIAKNQKNLMATESKLQNEKFTARAPESVVNAEREKAEKFRAFIAQLEESKEKLKKL